MVEATQSLTTFYVEGWRFGLPSGEIREVILDPKLTFVPLLSPEVRGVFNVRGEIVTVIDLRRRLGLPPREPEPLAHMIIETPDGTVSLLVDRPGDVLSVDRSSFETPPTRLSEKAQDCVVGAYKAEQELVLLLDSNQVLAPTLHADSATLDRARAATGELVMKALHRISLARRLLLISLAYTVPVVALAYFELDHRQADIEFSSRELTGNRLQRPLEDLLEAFFLSLQRTHRVAAGQTQSSVEESLAKVDAALSRWAESDRELGAMLQFTPGELRRRGRQDIAFNVVDKEWRELRLSISGVSSASDASALIDDHWRLISKVRTAVSHAGDISNLILDPDLDSYYLMDVTLLALPQTQERIARIMQEIEPLAADFARSRHALRFEERRTASVHAAQLRESDLERIKTSLSTSLNEDADFYGESETLIQIKAPLENFDRSVRLLIEALDATAQGTPTDPVAFAATGERALRASFALWHACVSELDTLIERRLDHKRAQRDRVYWVSGSLLALAALLVWGIGASIRRPLSRSARNLIRVANTLDLNSSEMATHALDNSQGVKVAATTAMAMSDRVQAIAGSTEDLGTTVREIARNAAQAAAVATAAVSVTDESNAAMSRLDQSTAEIGNVVKLISGIAEQTNLLALNATIEAARAGEIGKGFAVVATEVKELARETAHATEDIVRRIDAIMGDSRGALESLSRITAIIGEINAFQTGIAGAVEEQTATVSEIGRTIHEAAAECTAIATRVASFQASLERQAQVAELVHGSSEDLNQASLALLGLLDGSQSVERSRTPDGARDAESESRQG